jgi:hypothetical protein
MVGPGQRRTLCRACSVSAGSPYIQQCWKDTSLASLAKEIQDINVIKTQDVKLALEAALKFTKWIISGRLIFVCTNTQALTANCGKPGGQPGSGAPCVCHCSSVEILHPPRHLPRSSEAIKQPASNELHLGLSTAIMFCP